MKSFKFFTLVFIFCHFGIYSQQNLPLKFTSDQVKWSELTWIEGNKKSDQRFENRVSPIIQRDTIYFFMNYLGFDDNGVSIGYSGYSIKKMNIQTGQKYWEIQRMYKNGSKRKALSEPSFKNNKLTITLYDEASTTGTDWAECYPAHIVIDPNKGTVIDSQYVDRNNTGLPKFFSIAGHFKGRNPKFYINSEGYIFRFIGAFFQTVFNYSIENQFLNSEGYKISHDTFNFLNSSLDMYEYKYFETEQGITAFIVSEQENWRYKDMKSP